MRYPILKSSFLGNPLKKGQQYTIIGGGIAGLIMGYTLKKNGIPFRLLEQSDRVGGLLKTHQTAYGLVEQAANGFIWCPEVNQLCKDLDLPILGPNQASKARFLVRERKLKKFPLNFGEMLAAFAKISLPHQKPIETIAEFGQTYLGGGMTDFVLEPAFAGIYGADIKRLSFRGALTPLARILNKSSHLPLALIKNRMDAPKIDKEKQEKRGKGTHSFEGGMSEMVNKLEGYLQSEIEYNADGLKLVDSKEALILCTPSNISQHFFSGEMKNMLAAVQYTSMITATLVFRKADIERFQEGFGCLIPRSEGLDLLGVLFNTCIFPNRVNDADYISLTCMLRDDTPEKTFFQKTDLALQDLCVNELDQLFGVASPPVDCQVFRWEYGIPLYSPEMYNNLFSIQEKLVKEHPNRNLFGNYTGEISIRGMIQQAYQLSI